MIKLNSMLKRGLAALAVAGAFGLATAAPAQANPTFNFSFSVGTQGGNNGGFSPAPVQTYNCMTNARIRSGLRNMGYYNIQYVGESFYGYPEFQAVNNGWIYTMQVDRCSGNVYNLHQVQPVYVQPQPQPVPGPFLWPRVYVEPRPFGGNSDIIYHRN